MFAINIELASQNDIERLIKVRFDYFAAENWVVPGETAKDIENQLRSYFCNHLNIDFFAALVYVDEDVASAAFLSITERPASIFVPTGKFGFVQNVLTYPEHRRKGCAAKALAALIDEGKKHNLSYIELSASAMGKPLYQSLGFKEHTGSLSGYTAMRLDII